MARRILLLLACLGWISLAAQPNMIEWDPDQVLNWQDFKAPPDNTSTHAAATYSGVRYTYSYTQPQLSFKFDVVAYFDKNRSWVKPAIAADHLLAHEQLHFDIAELHARKLRKAFAKHHFTEQFENQIKRLHAQNSAERRAMQQRYDFETDHSNNTEAQQRWSDFVKQQLRALAAFR